jgi:MFS family permease
MLYGGSYALLNPLWGWVADNISSKLVIMIGSFLLGLGYLLVGPVPGLGIQSSYSLCIVSVVLVGLGVGAQLVAAFSEAQASAVASGFPDSITTYALVSSIWTSAFALGAFVGPTAAGKLF